MSALENTNMPKLKLVAKGKVRDIYALPDEADSDKLLFVATDRISAFDIIMDNVRNQGRRIMRKVIRLLMRIDLTGYPEQGFSFDHPLAFLVRQAFQDSASSCACASTFNMLERRRRPKQGG